jgi:hypothetical protein
MKLSLFERFFNWMIDTTIEIQAARIDAAQQYEIKQRFDNVAAAMAMRGYGIMSNTAGRAQALALPKMTPAQVHDSGCRDSRPYQAAVEQAVIDASGSEYRAWQASGDALHLSPEYIAQEYGEAAGQAALELQLHNAAR